ncbi:hypothetical protein [Chitinophaga eiseniae]|uniref:Uncharacterized protein n=1 Tax=Chitinophaga eiseniae TaxID=634771 RepID=A0A847SMM7_9BACT|nr:hypothetical protein [Chitinophaga eiseniae]NLR81444.1 hypothetical protein [Chitinophaga eiseniae]
MPAVTWMNYKTVTVAPGATFRYNFPEGFQARWIRFNSNQACKATAWLDYQ